MVQNIWMLKYSFGLCQASNSPCGIMAELPIRKVWGQIVLDVSFRVRVALPRTLGSGDICSRAAMCFSAS
jgi:hypothetical protein